VRPLWDTRGIGTECHVESPLLGEQFPAGDAGRSRCNDASIDRRCSRTIDAGGFDRVIELAHLVQQMWFFGAPHLGIWHGFLPCRQVAGRLVVVTCLVFFGYLSVLGVTGDKRVHPARTGIGVDDQ